MELKHTIKDKIVEIEIEEFNKFVNYVKDLKSKLNHCIKINRFYRNEINEYNTKFAKGKDEK